MAGKKKEFAERVTKLVENYQDQGITALANAIVMVEMKEETHRQFMCDIIDLFENIEKNLS